jgi:hypothetical protein
MTVSAIHTDGALGIVLTGGHADTSPLLDDEN